MTLFKIKEVKVIKSKSKDSKTIYKIEGVDYQNLEEIEKIRKEAGRFILATNLVDDDKLKPEEILTNYKNQQSCERGFRFMKDPLFFATDTETEVVQLTLLCMKLCLPSGL